jgi:diguanylate cyclase (GGDEF)-like protein
MTTRTTTAPLPPPSPLPLRHRLRDLLLTTDRVQALRLRQTALALVLMAFSVALLQFAAWLVELPRGPLNWWAGFSVAGLLVVYLAIRSGWSLRFADPSLTVPQMSYAIACSAVGYALVGPVRGVAFPILMVILMFGMFKLRARSALGISLFALLCFGLSMAWMSSQHPQAYPWTVELTHFLMLACMLPAVSLLAGRLSQIRLRLATQKQELGQALEQIQAMATRDDLTGLLNRRHMQTLMEQETQRCVRNGRSYCVALLDIDHFKHVNDGYGHSAGDAVLRAFAEAGQGAIRSADVLARWGGEEFVLMLSDTRMPLATVGVERLREQVAAMQVEFGGQRLQITVSAGLTEHRFGDTLAQTLERADMLLYEAKSHGRNRVMTE